jgi:hypothetical protein
MNVLETRLLPPAGDDVKNHAAKRRHRHGLATVYERRT